MANSRLKELKQQLIDKCASPESLLCPILQEVPTELVVTPYGHIYNRKEVTDWIQQHHSCPLTKNPLVVADLMENEKLKLMASIVVAHMSNVMHAINTMSLADEEKVLDKVTSFNELIKLTDLETEAELEQIRQPLLIKALKNQLRLDMSNAQHLEYWQNQCNTRFDNYLHVTHQSSGKKYYIPNIVHQLMLTASIPYQTKAEFKTALDLTREKGRRQPGLFEHPISNIASYFRTPAGTTICDIADVEKLRFGG